MPILAIKIMGGGKRMDTVLKIDKIEKYYGNKDHIAKVIDQISFEVKKGEFVGIMGPSGSGKTTLLNCIATIDYVTTGNIFIRGNNMTVLGDKELEVFRRDELGFIFQEYNLLDTLTAFENIALPLALQGKEPEEIDRQVQQVATQLDIEALLEAFPHQVSGGQKQRIACARAIVTSPTLVLADEPTGALDSKSAQLVLESLEQLNKQLETTLLMVTHDAFTASYASRILFIKDGKVFNELYRGEESRKQFFYRIMEVVTLLGGDIHHAHKIIH